MSYQINSLNQLIENLAKLPGIGKKTAQRLAFFILKTERSEVMELAKALVSVKDNVKSCSVCFNITETDPCEVCTNPRRDKSIICVVEEPSNILTIERTNEFRGLYHVLGGALSPLTGVSPDTLKIRELISRLEGDVNEIILATNPTVEGEATAIYLSKTLGNLGVKVTRIARGLPMGGDIEYADEVTLAKAFANRS
ncbi:MAG: recombination protein RecR [Calditrichaeota bacterium]|nr:MAG: recombination protein RecR [Calditrichota bacterium]